MIQKAHIKIVSRAILHLPIFSYRTQSSSAAKEKVVVIAVFLSKLDHRPLFNYMYFNTILV